MCEQEQSIIKNIAAEMERAIAEIKILGLTKQRLETLEEHCRELRALKKWEKDQEGDEAEEEDTQMGPPNAFEFRRTTCLVIKHIDLRERKGKQNSSVCKQCANNKLKEYRNKSRKDRTSRYECVCGSINFGNEKTNESLEGMGTNYPLIVF